MAKEKNIKQELQSLVTYVPIDNTNTRSTNDGSGTSIFHNLYTSIEEHAPNPLIITPCSQGTETTIMVESQNDLNNFNHTVQSALRSHDTVNVIFKKGVYYVSKNMIVLEGLPEPEEDPFQDKNLNIIGNDSTIIASSTHNSTNCGRVDGFYKFQILNASNKLAYSSILLDANNNFITDFYGELKVTESLFQVSETGDQMVLLHSGEREMTADECQDMYIQIFMWYYSWTFKVIRIDSGGNVYISKISVDNQTCVYNDQFEEWSPNLHRGYGGKNPLYRFINKPNSGKAFIKGGYVYCKTHDVVTLCDQERIININQTKLQSMTITGFNFVGCKGNISEDYALICINKSQNIEISYCSFDRIASDIFSAKESRNIIIRRNRFTNFYRRGVYMHQCENVSVDRNEFTEGNRYQSNNPAIFCVAQDYNVAWNKIVDYCYCAIAVGEYHAHTWPNHQIKGYVENNEVVQTSEFRSKLANIPLMDGSAIYVYTKNDETVIRSNFISGHAALKDGRGILCDDGAYGVSLYGNMIINIRESYCIDLRKCVQTACEYNKDNLMMYNVVDGNCRFEGRYNEGITSNYKGRNYVLTEHVFSDTYNSFNNIGNSFQEHDVCIDGCKVNEYTVAIHYQNANLLQLFILSDFIKSHLRKNYF